MGKRSTVCKFPVARIKKIMQADEDVGKVAAATPVAVCKALELFMENIMEEAVKEARSRGSKKVTAYHLKRTVHENDTFDFLKEIVAKVADPVESTAEGDTRGGKRRKTTASGGAGASGSGAESSAAATAAAGPSSASAGAGPSAGLASATLAAPHTVQVGPAGGASAVDADEDYDEEEDEDGE